MFRLNPSASRIFLSFLFLVSLLSSCEENEIEEEIIVKKDVEVIDFTPKEGVEGEKVRFLLHTNGAEPAEILSVTINDSIDVRIDRMAPTHLDITLPVGFSRTEGPYKVVMKAGNKEKDIEFLMDFHLLKNTITPPSFSPSEVKPGDTLIVKGQHFSKHTQEYYLKIYDSQGNLKASRYPLFVNEHEMGFVLYAPEYYELYHLEVGYAGQPLWKAEEPLIFLGTYKPYIVYNENFCPYSLFRLFVTKMYVDEKDYEVWVGDVKMERVWFRPLDGGDEWAFEFPSQLPVGNHEVKVIYKGFETKPLWDGMIEAVEGTYDFYPKSMGSGGTLNLEMSHITVASYIHILITNQATGEVKEVSTGNNVQVAKGSMKYAMEPMLAPGNYRVDVYYDSYYSESEKYFLQPVDSKILTVTQ